MPCAVKATEAAWRVSGVDWVGMVEAGVGAEDGPAGVEEMESTMND